MQIPRRILFACVATTILSLNFSQAQDTEAQRKAREALEHALNPNATQPAVEAAPAASQPQKPAARPATQAPAARMENQNTVSATTRTASDENVEKAREALRQKMNELGNASAPAQSAPPAEKPMTETPAAKPAPATIQEPAKQTPVVQAPARRASDDALEKARQALHEKMNELENAAPVEATAPATTPAPAVVQQPAMQNPPVQENTFQTPPTTSDENIEKAREAMREKWEEIEKQKEAEMKAAQPEVVTTPAQPEPEKIEQPEKVENVEKAEKPQKPKVVAHEKNPNAFPPMSAPPTGLTAEQEQRLAELLEQYKADKLTPDQYHAERAKVLANH